MRRDSWVSLDGAIPPASHYRHITPCLTRCQSTPDFLSIMLLKQQAHNIEQRVPKKHEHGTESKYISVVTTETSFKKARELNSKFTLKIGSWGGGGGKRGWQPRFQNLKISYFRMGKQKQPRIPTR